MTYLKGKKVKVATLTPEDYSGKEAKCIEAGKGGLVIEYYHESHSTSWPSGMRTYFIPIHSIKHIELLNA